MKNIGLLFLSVLFFSQIGFAQYGSIKGKVIEKTSKEELVGVSVVLHQGKKFITEIKTDIEGNYQLNRIKKGIYNFQIAHPIYKTKTIQQFQLNSNKILIINVSLEKTDSKETILPVKRESLLTPPTLSPSNKNTP